MERERKQRQFRQKLGKKKAFAGFDGYTDLLYSVVQSEKQGTKQMFKLSEEFAKSLLETSGMSSEYEIVLRNRRVGGNAPIMSIGMASMGANVSCVGLFKKDDLMIGNDLDGELNLYSWGSPATTVALEFEDCKYMLADCGEMKCITCQNLEEVMKENKIDRDILKYDLIAIVNWAAIPELKIILKNMFLSEADAGKMDHKWLFLDLSDIKTKEKKEIEEYFAVIKQIRDLTGINTCLSVNENELRVLREKLQILSVCEEEVLQEVRKILHVTEIILHAMKKAVYCSEEEMVTTQKKICTHPVLTTGAGDNFNAGVCVGKLLELKAEEQLQMGNHAAEFYVTHGYSGKLEEVLDW